MSLADSILDWIKAVIEKIIAFITNFIEEYWLVLLAIVLICYAPGIGSWLTTNGFASLGSAFTWVGATVTQPVLSALSTVWSGVAAVGSAFADAGLGTQLAVVAGSMALIAPEEATAVIDEAIDLASDVIGSVVGAVVSATNILPWLLGGLGLYLIFTGDDEGERA
jgi:phage-related protein